MRTLSFFLAISLATIVMFPGCKDKKPLEELTGTKWKSENTMAPMENDKGEVIGSVNVYFNVLFEANKKMELQIRNTETGILFTSAKGQYEYSYPDIKFVSEGRSLDGKFSSKDQFAVHGLFGGPNKPIIFHREK